MKITTEQLNTALAEAFGEIWVVKYYCFEETLGRSYYNNEQEAIEEIKRYNKENNALALGATLCGQFKFK